MKLFNLLFFIMACVVASAQKSPVYVFGDRAIKGYDPVAYFKEGKPMKGNESMTYTWKGVKWCFSSRENLEDFKDDPKKFAPEFGGYCSYGVSKGALYKIDPDAWKIVEGKLYLNYNKNIKIKWEANQTELINQAEANWPRILDK